LVTVLTLGSFAAASLAQSAAPAGAPAYTSARAEPVAARAASVTRPGESAPYDWDRFAPSRSRDEVRTEAAAAVAAGKALRGDREIEPVASFVSTKTRAQVRAEAIEALRLGLVSHGDFTEREATPAELELVRMAGLRARAAEARLAGK
jgi:hypothetical protein